VVDGTDPRARLHRQRIVREVNRRVEDLSGRWELDGGVLLVLCECGTSGCTSRVEIPREAFDAMLAEPDRFVTLPGHEHAADRVVERRGAFVILDVDGDG
jgi:hypothetical protein